jgi:diadenosine tetraphosphate (Ap4A) HIT family hydrolase
MATYDDNNIFAKILRGEIPCKKVYEDDLTFAFEDIHPQAPVHTLVIPKGKYVSLVDFADKAPEAEMRAVLRTINKVAEMKGIAERGYRVLTNIGREGGQSVPHVHFHILGGKQLAHLLGPDAI